MSKPTTRRVSAQRLSAAYNFDMSALAGASTGASTSSLASIPVLPPNGATGRDGRGPFTYDIATVVANVKANGADIPVFLDHEPGAAVGWIAHKADPVQSTDGSWEWPVSYTAEGLEHLLGQSYRYNSPTFLFIQDTAITDRQAGQIVGVLEVSLTNLPNLVLRSLNSAEQGGYTVNIPSNETETTVTPEQLAALGLTESATADEVTAAITALTVAAQAATAKVTEIVTAAGADAEADATAIVEAAANSRVASGALVSKQAFDEVTAARDAAIAAHATATAALASFQSAQADAAAVAAVDAAITAGKYVPAAREALCKQARADLATFQAVTAAMPVHPAASANSVATHSMTDETHGLSAEQLANCAKFGINPAIYAKNLRTSA